MVLPRYAELIRVSSQGQAARDSPQTQRNELDALRASRPGTLVERIDSVVSGASDERADLARLFELLAAKAIDEVRVRHIDRLTRHPDPRERAAILGALIDAGAVIVEASGRVIDPADEMGELDATLQGWFASRERKRIRERTLARRRELAREGKIQGRPPYGRIWDKRTGTWSEDRATMPVYRRLFREVLAGRSLAQIADRLNADGIGTPLGRPWTPAHVSRLIRHPSAVGRIEGWGQVFRCPAVVTEPEWTAAKEMLRKRRQERAGPPGHHPALLRRILRCSCGAVMWVQRGGRPGDVRSFYVCATYRQATDPECRRWHSVEAVDAKVKEMLLVEARRPTVLHAAAQRSEPMDPIEEAKAAVDEAAQELARLDRQEDNLLRLLRRGIGSKRGHEKQAAEILRLRQAAEVEHRAAVARIRSLERAAKEQHDVAESMTALARRLERASFADWARFLRRLSFRLHPDDRITYAGELLPVRLRAVR